jgi:hypothetical protein
MGEDGEEVGLSLVAFAERLLDFSSLGDVDERRHRATRPTLVVSQGCGIPQDMTKAPVLELQRKLEVPDLHPLAGSDLDRKGLGR